MFGYEFIHKGRTWNAIWLDTDSKLTNQDRKNILIEIADCYVEKDKTRKLKGENYEGRVFARGYYQDLNGFAGRRFDIELETDTRKSKLSGLIRESVDASLN